MYEYLNKIEISVISIAQMSGTDPDGISKTMANLDKNMFSADEIMKWNGKGISAILKNSRNCDKNPDNGAAVCDLGEYNFGFPQDVAKMKIICSF